MPQEKELLLKDLCARLPYGVKVHAKCIDTYTNTEVEKVGVLSMIDTDTVVAFTSDDTNCYIYVTIHEVKPYLFPLSSMTKVQEDEWYESFIDPLSKRIGRHTRQEDLQLQADAQAFGIEYLLKNHFDIYGLIPMGLALNATGLNIY